MRVMLQLCKTLVRLHLDQCVQFCLSHNRKDAVSIERVQERSTRMFSGMEAAVTRRDWMSCVYSHRKVGNSRVTL